MKDMDIYIYHDDLIEEREIYLVAKTSYWKMYGINLTTLYKDNLSYLFSCTENALDNFFDIEDKDVFFDENISKLIKQIFKKRNEILERATTYGLKNEYEAILNAVEEKYGALSEV